MRLKSTLFFLLLVTSTASLTFPASAQQLSCNNGVILRAGTQISTTAVNQIISNTKKEISRTQKRLLTAKKSTLAKLQKKIKTLKSNLKRYKRLLESCVSDPTSDTDPSDDQRIKITKQKYNGYTLTVFEDTKKYATFDLRDSVYIQYIDENGEALVGRRGFISDTNIEFTNILYRWNGKQLTQICAPDKCSLPTFEQSPPVNGRVIIGVSKTKTYRAGDVLTILLANEKGYFPLEGYTPTEDSLQNFALNAKGEVISLDLNDGQVVRWNSLNGQVLPPINLNTLTLPTAIALENEHSKVSKCTPLGTRRLSFTQFAMAVDGTMGLQLENEYDCTQYGQSGRGTISAHLIIENGAVKILEGSIYSASSITDLPLTLDAVGSLGTALLRSSDSSQYLAHGKLIRETAFDTIYDRYIGVNSRGEVIATRVKQLSDDPTDNYVSLDTGTGPSPLKAILGVPGTTHFNLATDINECGEISGGMRYTSAIEELNKAFIAVPDRCM